MVLNLKNVIQRGGRYYVHVLPKWICKYKFLYRTLEADQSMTDVVDTDDEIDIVAYQWQANAKAGIGIYFGENDSRMSRKLRVKSNILQN